MKVLSLVLFITGSYLVIEGLLSFIVFSDQDVVYQVGRMARVFIGFMVVWLGTKSRGY